MAKAPSFQFYCADFLMATLAWKPEERGCYISLLAHQWINNYLPIDLEELAIICNAQIDQFLKVWDKKLKAKFQESEPGKLKNSRLEECRTSHENFVNKQTSNGKKGGRPKEENPKETQTEPKANPNHNPDQTQTITQTITQKNPLEDEDEVEEEEEKEKEEEKGKKVKEKREKFELILPFDTPEFSNAWLAWRQYRQSEHKSRYKSTQTEQIALKQLVDLSQGVESAAIRIIQQSIGNTWKGFFPLKDGRQQQANSQEAEGKRRFPSRYP